MDYIDSTTTRHAMHFLTRRRVHTDGGWAWRARTLCGREVTGTSGGCIAQMIGCRTCRRAMDAQDR